MRQLLWDFVLGGGGGSSSVLKASLHFHCVPKITDLLSVILLLVYVMNMIILSLSAVFFCHLSDVAAGHSCDVRGTE